MTPESPTPATKPPGFIGRLTAAEMGLYVLMGSMTVLFGAGIVGYLFTRFENALWVAPGMPGLPPALLLSTACIAATSWCFSRAVKHVSANRLEAFERFLWFAFVGAAAFLVVQAYNWRVIMVGVARVEKRTLYASTFYILTGVHAAHVIGGFVPLGIVLRKARLRQYSSSRNEGVRLCRRYWDYLGIVWAVLLSVLYFAT